MLNRDGRCVLRRHATLVEVAMVGGAFPGLLWRGDAAYAVKCRWVGASLRRVPTSPIMYYVS